MTASSFIRDNGTYRSVHWGPDRPSPIVAIVGAAWNLARSGAHTYFGPGVNEHYLKALADTYGQLGEEEILSPHRVMDVIKIWGYIKNHPSINSILGTDDRHVVEAFLRQATAYYDLS